MTTHRLYRTPIVRGNETLTTHTDYVKSYPSQLQTTSYNFTGTATTGELCAGVVKAAGVFEKNPEQHNADFEMLQEVLELQPAFFNETEHPKRIECVRVDGSTDEGPSHVEVQFWWTRRHVERPTHATILTARNSGSSYLNRVELQNGCLAVAHANLFIPSNLNGSCFDPATGKVNQDRLEANMSIATQIYIDRVNGAPCGTTNIHLLSGSKSSLNIRTDVLTYLKGTKEQKSDLRNRNPEMFKYIQNIWDIRLKHGVPDLPSQYCFMLKCCYELGCSHPCCVSGQSTDLAWFPGGPSLSYLPFPVPDPDQQYGSSTCSKCTGECAGHFLPPEQAERSSIKAMTKPPSTLIKEAFTKLKGQAPTSEFFDNLAKQCLLLPEEVKMWVEHLVQVNRNRQRGAQKAAQTRLRKKQQSTTLVEEACEKDLVTSEVPGIPSVVPTIPSVPSGGASVGTDFSVVASVVPVVRVASATSEVAKEVSRDVSETEVTLCAVCTKPYKKILQRKWIACDFCNNWFHFKCVKLEVEPNNYICLKCSI